MTPGRTVVVTGVGRAGQVGEAIAAAFAADGAALVLIARALEDAQARADELRRGGRVAHPFACDLTDHAAVADVAAQVGRLSDRVDALINVAGGFAMSGPVASSDPAALANQIAINVTTAYCATRAFLPALRSGRGSIVYFSSASALPGGRVKEMSAYAIAKSGVIALMRAVAQEERANGVRANAVAPTAIRTTTNLASMDAASKFVERESLAAVVRFLCSGAAANVSGQVFELAP
jgi:NAD(P)-dependent dehydrogenase (short-subunit alcohol dehydrogenase family)